MKRNTNSSNPIHFSFLKVTSYYYMCIPLNILIKYTINVNLILSYQIAYEYDDNNNYYSPLYFRLWNVLYGYTCTLINLVGLLTFQFYKKTSSLSIVVFVNTDIDLNLALWLLWITFQSFRIESRLSFSIYSIDWFTTVTSTVSHLTTQN